MPKLVQAISAIDRGAKLLSIRAFAEQMGCSISLARKLCYGRKVAHVKFCKNLMVPASEVDRLIEANLTPALNGTE
jgi:hypothetical protein